MKNENLNKAISCAAILAACGMGAYTFIRTYKTVKSLENADLDFGNDPVLSSLFNRKDEE